MNNRKPLSIGNIAIEGATIRCRNFSGREDKFNPKGRRNFLCVIDDPELVDKLKNDGWNIKQFASRNDEEGDYYIPVSVSYKVAPPSIFLVTRKKKIRLDEETVSQLDWTEMENVDLIISPSRWEVNGRSGIKAYLKSMYVTVVEDCFSDKYRDCEDDIPDDDECPF